MDNTEYPLTEVTDSKDYSQNPNEPSDKTNSHPKEDDLLYGIDDIPSWSTSCLVGFQILSHLLKHLQGDTKVVFNPDFIPLRVAEVYIVPFNREKHYLAMIGGTIATPLIVCSFLCMSESDVGRGYLVSTIIFVSGIITLLQTTFGVRLPIIQGGNFAYLVPTITILTTSFPPCSSLPLTNMTESERTTEWQVRIRELQGAITISALFQVLVGFTGLVGALLAWITPLSIVPTVTLLGLSLYKVGASQASGHWGIACLTMILLIVMSQYLKDVAVPLPIYRFRKGLQLTRYPVFTFYPLLISVCITWSLCAVLTTYDFLPENSSARTDSFGTLLSDTPWFRVPYPGQWGAPTVSIAGVIGVMAGVIASIIESIGDYYACARVARAPPPPTHAINRGVGMEGIGCVLAGLWGTSSGTASYTGNIALIGISKVASRRTVQVSGALMLICGTFGKFGAFFATLPVPVLGGVLIYFFGIITALGLSTLQFVNLSSSRNMFVLGFSLFMGIAIPNWLEKNPNAIQTGSPILDQSLTVLLQTTMFVGGCLGCFLDNTVPGTDEERGIIAWNEYLTGGKDSSGDFGPSPKCYDLPWGMNTIKRWKWFSHFPFSPTFQGFRKRNGQQNRDLNKNIPVVIPSSYSVES